LTVSNNTPVKPKDPESGENPFKKACEEDLDIHKKELTTLTAATSATKPAASCGVEPGVNALTASIGKVWFQRCES
jgi:hypothetical protein